MTYRIHETCCLCGGALERVLSLPDTPLANAFVDSPRPQQLYPLHVDQCVECEHVQTPVEVDPKLLFSEYAYVSGTAASFRAHLASLAQELYDAGHRTIVDIGSNDGTLIDECRKLGMRGIGIDPAGNLAALASAKCCLTIPAFFTPAHAKEIKRVLGGAPDVVTALNVFAHCRDLGGIADGVRELIGDTGTFVFEVAYLRDILKKNETGTLYHEHSSHWHVIPMRSFFERHGLALCDVQRLEVQGGSIRGYVRGHSTGLAENVALFALSEFQSVPRMLEEWPARVEKEREETLAMLRPYLGQGLAIYGAPARLTTYAYMLGLKNRDVMCVFDDNPLKVGKFTPGLNWPVVASSGLPGANPRAVLIASWNYADEIRAKFPHYKGEWILPRRS